MFGTLPGSIGTRRLRVHDDPHCDADRRRPILRPVNVVEFLGSYAPFDSLSDDDLMGVASDARVEEFPAGTLILEQAGTPASSIYVVASGSVELLDPPHW